MLDIKKIREELPEVKAALLKRMSPEDLNLEEILNLDDERRKLTTLYEEMQARRKRLSKTKPTPEIISELRSFGDE
ncbi:MAG: serine--tRNA ligase, partial [Patescibacteria group bacterium]